MLTVQVLRNKNAAHSADSVRHLLVTAERLLVGLCGHEQVKPPRYKRMCLWYLTPMPFYVTQAHTLWGQPLWPINSSNHVLCVNYKMLGPTQL